nr:hypothetical protein B0A51_11789 [Rachicladosporium sp. CCFEE 5018]
MMNAGSLLHDGKYSDFTILCRGEIIPIYRSILSLASPVPTKAFDLDMREKQTGVIQQDEFDVETVKRMSRFTYTGDYAVTVDKGLVPESSSSAAIKGAERPADGDQTATTVEADKSLAERIGSLHLADDDNPEMPIHLLEHVRVYGIAEYYDFAQLKTAAANHFIALFDQVWNLNKADRLIALIQEVIATSAADHDELRSRSAKALASLGTFLQLGEKTDFYAALGRCEGTQS